MGYEAGSGEERCVSTHRQRVHEASWPAFLAAYLAQRIGLPPGNMWEPAICRNIQKRLDEGVSKEQVRAEFGMSIMGWLPDEIPEDVP